MNMVAIMASYRKGRTIDTLVDRAIAGALDANPGATAEKITLIDKHIEYGRHGMACRNDDPLIKDFCKIMLNARLLDTLYAGAIEKCTVDHYTRAAFRLGRELVR